MTILNFKNDRKSICRLKNNGKILVEDHKEILKAENQVRIRKFKLKVSIRDTLTVLESTQVELELLLPQNFHLDSGPTSSVAGPSVESFFVFPPWVSGPEALRPPAPRLMHFNDARLRKSY